MINFHWMDENSTNIRFYDSTILRLYDFERLKMSSQLGRNNIIRTELFDFTRTEYIFKTGSFTSVQRLMNSPDFKDIIFDTEYKGKNGEMYKNIGEFLTMTCVIKIFNSYTKIEYINWINVLCLLFKRGCINEEIISRINSYISQKRMPRMLRCIIRIIMNKYLSIWKEEMKSLIGDVFYTGLDSLITSYVL